LGFIEEGVQQSILDLPFVSYAATPLCFSNFPDFLQREELYPGIFMAR
jgi:hypothetical protein